MPGKHEGHVWGQFSPEGQDVWCDGDPDAEAEAEAEKEEWNDFADGNIWGLKPYLEIMQDAWARFVVAYAEYGDSSKEETGLAGQWADLYRKIMKLKAPLWAGEKGRLTRENEKDILCDLIGHSLLALEMLQRGAEGGRGAAG